MTRRSRLFEYAGIVGMILALLPSAAATYYAGYYYCSPPGTSCSTALKGDYGSIYTIDPTIKGSDFFTQSVTTIFSYSPFYWVQSGYAKNGPNLNLPHVDTTYCEYNNGNEYRTFLTYPATGSTHWYQNQYQTNNQWLCSNDQSSGTTWSTSWNHGVDLQALSEMTNSCIKITNTHYSSLEYYSGVSGYVWGQHAKWQQSPYSVTELGNYEFTASGGAGC